MTAEMFDSIDPSQIPAGQDAAGYVDGRWRTFTALHGPHNLSVAVFETDNADAADDEPGDMTNAQAAQWAKRELGLGHWRPCIYTSVSNVPALLAALSAVGITRGQVRIWTAHYTYRQHRCTHACWSGLPADFLADASQWTDRSGGKNLDESTVADDFFNTPTVPAPAGPSAPIVYPEDDLQQVNDNVSIAGGVGWAAIPSSLTGKPIVSVIVYAQDPTKVGYLPLPAFVGYATDGQKLLFGPGAHGPAPDGVYGFTIFAGT